MFATYDSGPYKFVVLIHIASAICAFGTAVTYPALAKMAPAALKAIHTRIGIASISIAGVAGSALAGMSSTGTDPSGEKVFVYSPTDTWVMASSALWLVAVLIALLPMRSAIDKLVANPESVKKFFPMLGIYHLALTATLVLMVYKPGDK